MSLWGISQHRGFSLRPERHQLCAASATAGGVAVPNELLARAEAPFPREAASLSPSAEYLRGNGCRC